MELYHAKPYESAMKQTVNEMPKPKAEIVWCPTCATQPAEYRDVVHVAKGWIGVACGRCGMMCETNFTRSIMKNGEMFYGGESFGVGDITMTVMK